MKIPIYNLEGKTEQSISLPKEISELEVSPDLIHQVIRVEGLNQRRHWSDVKDRSEVRGGGRKPWRQKGTGRARHGSSRSPIWRGGGATFGPGKERVWSKKNNKKMKRIALMGILKEKLVKKDIVILEKFSIDKPKTSALIETLKKIIADKNPQSILLVVEKIDKTVQLAARNIKYLDFVDVNSIGPGSLIKPKKILITKEAFDQLIERLLSV